MMNDCDLHSNEPHAPPSSPADEPPGSEEAHEMNREDKGMKQHNHNSINQQQQHRKQERCKEERSEASCSSRPVKRRRVGSGEGVGRRLLRFAGCRLLRYNGDSGGGCGGGGGLFDVSGGGGGGGGDEDDGLINADLLVDLESGLIAGIVPADQFCGGCEAISGSAASMGAAQDEGDDDDDDDDVEEKKEENEEGAMIRADDEIVGLVDCRGKVLSPGFIDIQVNGAFGVDFSNPTVTPSQVQDVARKLAARHGVTSFCPTLISCSRETYGKVIPTVGRMCEAHSENRERKGSSVVNSAKMGARILGLHLEGPFFAPSKRGAHPAPHMMDPTDGLSTVLDAYSLSSKPVDDGVRIVTLAPEREGALDATRGLAESGVVVAMGHTEATMEQGEAAVREGGAKLLTHLFNAMQPFHHREPGLVGLLATDGSSGKTAAPGCGLGRAFQRPHWSVIADGIHVHPCAVRMARCAHPGGAVLVTDAMSAMGLGDGTHTLGNTSVEISAGRATVVGTDILAGSVASMDKCIRNYRQFSVCGTAEALRAATLHPARVLGIDGMRGRLSRGCYGDVVLLNAETLEVEGTWVGGRKVHETPERPNERRAEEGRLRPSR